MICPHCHSENRDGAKFCDECGYRLVSDAQETVVLADAPLAGQDACEGPAAPAKPAKPAKRAEAAADETADIYAELSSEGELDDFTSVDEEIVDAGRSADARGEQADDAPEADSAKTGALDPALVPEIDVVGVNVDSAGRHFSTSGDIDEADLSSDKTQVINIDSAKTADLSGLERLVDSSYVPPERGWRSGDTMELPKIEGEPPKQQKSFKAPDPAVEKRAHRKHVAIAWLVAILVAAAAIGVTYYLELWGGKTVPDVTGEAATDAAWMLESKGFSVNTTQVKSDEVEGIVLITDPAGGSRVKEGSTVNVSIATPRAVPDIMGKTQEDAQAALDKEGLSNVTFTTQKSNEAEGTVVALSIDAGTKVKAATALTVTLAESYVVPDVAGKSQDDAQGALEDAGYEVKIATEYTEDVAEGAALSTDPAAGSKLNSGSVVTLSVAKSRANEVVSATKGFFSKGATVYVNGVSYEVVSCDDVTYEGDGKASYSVTARKYENVSTLLFGNTTIYSKSTETLSGTITWGTDGSITGSSPKLSK